jgi:hypothetical protein
LRNPPAQQLSKTGSHRGEIQRATLAYLHQAAMQLAGASAGAVALWQAKVDHYRPLIERIHCTD